MITTIGKLAGTDIRDALLCVYANGRRHSERASPSLRRLRRGTNSSDSPFGVAPSARRFPLLASFRELLRAPDDRAEWFLGKLCSNIASAH